MDNSMLSLQLLSPRTSLSLRLKWIMIDFLLIVAFPSLFSPDDLYLLTSFCKTLGILK